MMKLLKDISIRCDKCGKVITIDKEKIDFESQVYDDHCENGMGEETEFKHEGCIKCDICGNKISFEIFGWEYPVGAFNDEDCKITGGKFEEKPDLGIIYSQNYFDLDYAYLSQIEQLIMNIAQNQNLIYNISSREFEEIIEHLFQDDGFKTKLTKATRDGGVDIIATKYVVGKPIVLYIECKRYGRQNRVGVGIVRSLFGVQTSNKVNMSILVTTGKITSVARKFVEEQKTMMTVIDVDEILDRIQQSAEKYRGY